MTAGALLDGVFPADIAVASSRVGDVPPELFPEEAALLAKAVEKRRREFAHGRACARRALAAHGAPAAPLLIGPAREPLWPPRFVGSITHDRELCVAVVARADTFAGLGVDVEPDEPLTPPVAARVWSPAEASAALALGVVPEDSAAKLVFAAKEAVYKCQFPLTRTFVGFHGVSVELATGSFTAALTAPV
ncbi:MAG TPA: 4'-phosphopantetheinyl transferase superfamily protein, partial [Polyangiaceae bacterium]|nr:4'-phosphopantetheinyl transferase superfamily protein [Polyangiaceae bacterium]